MERSEMNVALTVPTCC